jgi:DNA polymerase-3 subunit delta'
MLSNTIKFHFSHWEQLQSRRGQLPHALLLHGPSGIGKSEFALALAASLLCETPQQGGLACARCAPCNWLAQGNHPDFRHLRPAALAPVDSETGGTEKKKPSRDITIDQVRGLDDFLHIGAHRQGRRIVLIEPAEAMNRNTANALLKGLEEPGKDTLYLLVTDRYEQLLPTIRSRCQLIPFALPEGGAAVAWLQAQGVKQPEHWLALAGGAPLAAAALVEDKAGRAMLDQLRNHLGSGAGISPVRAAAELEGVIKNTPYDSALHPLRRLIDWLQRWCVDLALIKAGAAPRYHVADTEPLTRLSNQTSIENVTRFQRATNEFKKLSEHTLNNKLFLEEIFISYRHVFNGEKTHGR